MSRTRARSARMTCRDCRRPHPDRAVTRVQTGSCTSSCKSSWQSLGHPPSRTAENRSLYIVCMRVLVLDLSVGRLSCGPKTRLCSRLGKTVMGSLALWVSGLKNRGTQPLLRQLSEAQLTARLVRECSSVSV